MAATERREASITEPTRDCSMGFCSIYCHHWCYLLFPPPPSALILSPEATSRSPFSPLAIAIIGVLVTAFLLVSYYAIASKYCGAFASLRRRHHHHTLPGGSIHRDSNRDHETWHVVASPRRGLDQAAIDSIARWRYKKGDGLVDGGDCSICLGEFREDEGLRLLPTCGHAFHLRCVDTWLKSHSNCPLCRASVVAANGARGEESGQNVQVREEENPIENITVEAIPQTHGESEGTESDAVVEMMESDLRTLRRSASMGCLHHGREVNMEELVPAANGGFWIGGSSSTVSGGARAKTSNSSNFDGSLQSCARNPTLMRSFSGGRVGFRGTGRARNTILPL